MCFTQSGKGMRQQQMFEMSQAAILKQQQDEEAEKQRQMLLKQESDRKSNIAAGNANIDSAFGGFNDDYYQKAQGTYTGAYLPEINRQETRSMDRLKSALAGRGVLESTVGASAMADLSEAAAKERAGVASAGVDFVNSLKNKVADTKTSLYGQSQAAADPNAIASAATGQASALAEQGQLTPSPSGLGDLFGSLITPFVKSASAYQNSPAGAAERELSIRAILAGKGNGSSYNVR